MSDLENAIGSLDHYAVGRIGVVTYDEWIGGRSEFTCSHCKQQLVQSDYYYCPRCGDGLRPITCEHLGDSLPAESIPVIEVMQDDKGMRWAIVRCPDCNKKTSKRGRVKFALAAWNRCEWDKI